MNENLIWAKQHKGIILSAVCLLIYLLILGSNPVDFLRPKFRNTHTKHEVISILMNNYTYTNMYIIDMILSCIFILCIDITALLKLTWIFAGYVYSDDSLIRTRLFPPEISGLTSFPDYWIAQVRTLANF